MDIDIMDITKVRINISNNWWWSKKERFAHR